MRSRRAVESLTEDALPPGHEAHEIPDDDLAAADAFAKDYPNRERAYAFLMGPNPDPRCVNSVEGLWATRQPPEDVRAIALYLKDHPECLSKDLAGSLDFETVADLFCAYRSGRVAESTGPQVRVAFKGGDPGEVLPWEEFAEINYDMGPEELARIKAEVEAGRVHRGGGGAAPTFEVMPADVQLDPCPPGRYKDLSGCAPVGEATVNFLPEPPPRGSATHMRRGASGHYAVYKDAPSRSVRFGDASLPGSKIYFSSEEALQNALIRAGYMILPETQAPVREANDAASARRLARLHARREGPGSPEARRWEAEHRRRADAEAR